MPKDGKPAAATTPPGQTDGSHTATPEPRWRDGVTAWSLLVALLLIGPPAALAIYYELIADGPTTNAGQCRTVGPNTTPPVDSQTGSTVAFTPVDDTAVTLPLGRSGNRSQTEITLSVVEVRNPDGSLNTEPRTGATVNFDVRTAYLRRADGLELTVQTDASQTGSTQARGNDNTTYIQWRRATGAATLHVCLSRDQLASQDGGTYDGLFVIDDDRATELRIPFTVTLAYASWWWVAAATWIVAWASLILIFLVSERRPVLGIHAKNPAKHLTTWLFFGGGGALTLLTAGAVITTFSTGYLNDPDWGSSWSDMVALGGSVAATTLGVGGLTAVAAGEKLARQAATATAGTTEEKAAATPTTVTPPTTVTAPDPTTATTTATGTTPR